MPATQLKTPLPHVPDNFFPKNPYSANFALAVAVSLL
jgi:hypothetical protein